jgi:hypothetical protein
MWWPVSSPWMASGIPRAEAADSRRGRRPTQRLKTYLFRLLDHEDIPSTGSGEHRHIALADLLGYKQRRDARRREALRELTQMSQEFGLYDRH